MYIFLPQSSDDYKGNPGGFGMNKLTISGRHAHMHKCFASQKYNVIQVKNDEMHQSIRVIQYLSN